MTILKKTCLLAAALSCVVHSTSVAAQDNAAGFEPSLTKQFVDSIDSVAKAKTELRTAFVERDACAFGSCDKSLSIEICAIVAALDENTGGRILQKQHNRADFAISPQDAKNMKMVFSQCKPSSYQYWNDDQVLHVAYLPDKNVDAKVRAFLGVKKKSK